MDERSASGLINGGSPIPQRFHQKNQYASREEYESWQQLEWFRPPSQIRSTKFN